MGTYLSKPNTSTVTDAGKSLSLSYGVASMQGWRVTQEDAHSCILNFGEGPDDAALFAVFDGHGGAEVAEYSAKHLPLWIKKNEFYHQGDFEKALVESFLAFDQSLVEPHVLQVLKDMAETPSSDDEDDKINEAIALQEEADMPIEELMAKYGCQVIKKNEFLQDRESGDHGTGTSSGTSSAPCLSTASEKQVDVPDDSVNGHQNGSEIKTEEIGKEPIVKDKDTEVESGETNNKEEKVNGEQESIEKVRIKIDKGKGKKVIIPKAVETTEKKPLYEKFVEDFDDEESDESDSDSSGEEDEEDEDLDDDNEEEDDEDDDHEVSMGLGEIPGKDSGCTACVAFVHGANLFVANAGDSRCVVCRDGVAVDMSIDHKPEDEAERIRIEKAGGQVTADGRVNGGLNLSRALGDHTYKENADLPLKEQMISPEPDVKKLELTEKDEFFVVACDGIWNSLTSQEVVDFVRERIKSKNLVAICEELFHKCLAPDSSGDGTGCDNMTAVIVELKNKSLKRKVEAQEDEEGSEPCKKSKDQGCSSSSSSQN